MTEQPDLTALRARLEGTQAEADRRREAGCPVPPSQQALLTDALALLAYAERLQGEREEARAVPATHPAWFYAPPFDRDGWHYCMPFARAGVGYYWRRRVDGPEVYEEVSRETVLETVLRGVADARLDDGTLCYCGEDADADYHRDFCRAARAALGEE